MYILNSIRWTFYCMDEDQHDFAWTSKTNVQKIQGHKRKKYKKGRDKTG